MSYRIYINGVQIFGNNDFPNEFYNFLKEHNIDIDEDGCFNHTFEVGQLDIMELIDVVESCVLSDLHTHKTNYKSSDYNSWFDFRNYENIIEYAESHNDRIDTTLLDVTSMIFNSGKIFTPLLITHNLLIDGSIKACGPHKDKNKVHLYCYKQIKPITIQRS